MKKIILDTNFLLTALKFKVDIFSEINRICDFNYKIFVLDKNLDELKNIKVKESKLALALILSKNLNIIKTKKDKNVDNLILDLANNDYIVATQDKLLKQKLKQKNIKIITLRQKKYLILN